MSYFLFDSVKKNNLPKLKKILEKGKKSPNVFDSLFKKTPLHFSAWQGHLSICQYLVQRGADVNATSMKTPLILAAYAGKLDVLKFLLSVGANINAQDESGWTALHFAAQEEHLQCVRELLSRNADVTLKSNDGKLAEQLCRKNSLKLLFEPQSRQSNKKRNSIRSNLNQFPTPPSNVVREENQNQQKNQNSLPPPVPSHVMYISNELFRNQGLFEGMKKKIENAVVEFRCGLESSIQKNTILEYGCRKKRDNDILEILEKKSSNSLEFEGKDVKRIDEITVLLKMLERNEQKYEEIEKSYKSSKEMIRRRIEELGSESKICSICYEKEKDSALGCGHVFCSECSNQFSECPNCRAPVTTRTKLFL